MIFSQGLLSILLEVRTGFEPTTPGVTGRYSNQLNYRTTWFISLTVFPISIKLKSGSSLLSHGETPHYHRRYGISLLSSTWGQVGPPRYCRQTNSFLFIPSHFAAFQPAHLPQYATKSLPSAKFDQIQSLNKLKFSLSKTPSVLLG